MSVRAQLIGAHWYNLRAKRGVQARAASHLTLENENTMASPNDNVSMAVFCDFENVALGVRDANYDKFDIKPVLERLLLKGSIVVKKAYCDWDRYKSFKATMHEANFELIEIPHVRQSGKNSADIRLVVDALDLCYTKSHVNTFVIISGDSDFSPLVSKLRENAKYVIGVGVKQSTSDLLIANCDEFIFYDDLVRESRRVAAKRDARVAEPVPKRSPDEASRRKDDLEARKVQAIEMAVDTFDALVSERGDSGKIWASMLKEAIKRRKPDFSESYYGFRTFGNLLEEAQARGLLEFGRDEKSGAYVYRSSVSILGSGGEMMNEVALSDESGLSQQASQQASVQQPEARPVEDRPRRNGRGSRSASSGRQTQRGGEPAQNSVLELLPEPSSELVPEPLPEFAPAEAEELPVQQPQQDRPPQQDRQQEARRGGRGPRGRSGRDQGNRAPASSQERATLEPSMFEPAPERATLEPSMFEPAVAPAFEPAVEPAAPESAISESGLFEPAPAAATLESTMFEPAPAIETVIVTVAPVASEQPAGQTVRKGRAPRKPAAKKVAAVQEVQAVQVPVAPAAEAAPKAKPAARSRRPRKTDAASE
jgi:uncharacterized LabA/DUF88 family protein